MRRSNPLSGARACALVSVILVLATSCAGPRKPLVVGMKDYPTDVVMGSNLQPLAAPPLPPVILQPFTQPFTFPSVSGSAPLPIPCPSAGALATPTRQAGSLLKSPPVEATYTYRTDGEFQSSGANATHQPYPPTSTRTIRDVKTDDLGVVTYQIVVDLGATTTTTDYRVIPSPSPTSDTPGIYVTKISSVNDSKETVFTPDPPMQIAVQPMFHSDPWTVRSRDDNTNQVMTYQGQVLNTINVDACGKVLQAVQVHLQGDLFTGPCTSGSGAPAAAPAPADSYVPRYCGPSVGGDIDNSRNHVARFSIDYAFVPLYGGISIMDHIQTSGTENGQYIYSAVTMTINKEPAIP